MPTTSDPIVTPDPVAAVREFFERLGRYCARVDYDAAEVLFAPDVMSFGTRATVVSGLEPLRRNQWQGIWGNISDFRILLEQVHATGDASLAWGMAPWTSTGYDVDGHPFERPGRATVVLERRDDGWRAIHTHFSLAPGTPPTTHGPRGGHAEAEHP
ncbi:MAG: nuclear transport factor 2 family protein [Ectothiorhodospiraceae bacterium]|nr:nuclear transport factor 2 family protein [Ectothiorhodospiraceae bacterium]